ncbi:2-iminobutanoate/2-iminopropanoate deaminase-like [Orycteropus afer afer]|uniref:2-iminobutanoate/2-iminopropanoate deaminase n=1 Tax=Orycteropus afer afer TaxID=1230840 RepID=A0A8B7BD65_ORYAF|nr:2-iminobutanoate/2-iminopropanoate deaminase-like [Orycteropus afer afer]
MLHIVVRKARTEALKQNLWGAEERKVSLLAQGKSDVQAVLVDRTVYISGQLGMNPSSGQLVPGGVVEEAKQALTNMGEILKAAGCDFTNVVKTTVLLADINDFTAVNEVYKQYFKSSFPARAAYQVAALPKGGRIEIEAIAVQGPLSSA